MAQICRPPKDLEILLNNLCATIFKNKLLVNIIHQSSFPPTVAALKLQYQCSHFQTALWKASSMPSPPTIADGWEISGLEL